MVCYNLTVKRIAILTISLLLAITASGGAAAFAAQSETKYPQKSEFIKPLEFTSLADYAVEDDKYTFLQGDKVYLFENGELTTDDFDSEIYKFNPSRQEITSGNYLYYFDDDGALTVFNKSSKQFTTFEENYSDLKIYGEIVYAVSENVLYSFPDGEPQKINLDYYDYSLTQKISVGNTADVLKNGYTLKFVDIAEGSYMTQVDLTTLDGAQFDASETVKTEKKITALLLCFTGNAAVIALGEKSYILHSDDVGENTSVKYTFTPEFKAATILGDDIYSAPYVFTPPALSGAMNKVVEVESKIDCSDVLDFVFYKVKYTEADGAEKYGYVTSGLLSGIYITADNKDPSEITDPKYSEETDTKTILLILAVVVLILAAIGYLAHVGTSGRNKKSKKGKKSSKKVEE